IVMQQIAESSWTWEDNNDSMWMWNQYMNVFGYVDSDGYYAYGNDESEFCVFVSDDSLWRVYEDHWGTDTTATTYYLQHSGCGEIVEADIAFNAGKSW